MSPDELAALNADTLASRLGRLLDVAAGDQPVGPGLVDAAVLVPLLDGTGAHGADGPALLFMRRARDLPDHAGQVAFPGGVRELGDATLRDTALREASEEVAVAPGDVRLLGPLPRVSTLAKYSIQPFLSLWPPGRYGVASPAEVDHVFQVPLAWLAAPANSEETEIALPGGRRLRVPAWLWEGEVIWGATRRITLTLLDLVAALRS